MSNLNRLREHFHYASADLEIEIREDYEVRLPSGHRLIAPVFVPVFGGERGTVVVSDYDTIDGCASELVDAG